jgi:hypothetical protein
MPEDKLQVAEWRIEEWERCYHPLNVRAEIVKMQQWWEANPARRKKNSLRFVVNWLNSSYSQITTAQVQSRMQSAAGRSVGKMGYSASDKAFYEKFYSEHPELKPKDWE